MHWCQSWCLPGCLGVFQVLLVPIWNCVCRSPIAIVRMAVDTAGCVWLFPVHNYIWSMLLFYFSPVVQNLVMNFDVHHFCAIVMSLINMSMPSQSMRSGSVCWNLVLLCQYFLALLLQMCLRRFPLALRLTFLLPNQRCHGLLLNVRTVGSGWFWICPQCFFAAISIAVFQQALWDFSSSALSWWPLMCLHCHVSGVSCMIVHMVWMMLKCFSAGLQVCCLKHHLSADSPSHITRMLPFLILWSLHTIQMIVTILYIPASLLWYEPCTLG